LVDGELVLNRKNVNGISEKNKGEKNEEKIEDHEAKVKFSFNERTGNVNNRAAVIQWLIGKPPYGDPPVFPTDSEKNKVDNWGSSRGTESPNNNDKLSEFQGEESGG
jgi:hypothetical protein